MPPLREDLDRILHDLRGPLNSATMHLEVLKRAVADDRDALANVALIQQELSRLAAMLPKAFSVIALERGDVKRVGLRALVQRAIDEHGLSPVEVQEGAWPEVNGDADLLVLAIAHLLRNAIAAMREAGRAERPARVSVEIEGRAEVTLIVRDWGRGFKGANPKVLIRLGGVGLITVERVARLHGGRLHLTTPGDGAEVRLTLPA